MDVVSPDELASRLDWASLIDAIDAMLRDGCEAPLRHHHTVDVPGAASGTLLLMPAWSVGRYLGVKLANVFPGNASLGLPALSALYALCSARTGVLLALLDG